MKKTILKSDFSERLLDLTVPKSLFLEQFCAKTDLKWYLRNKKENVKEMKDFLL